MQKADILTFDIEDWFHILDLPGEHQSRNWEQYESRVNMGTRRILDLLEQFDTRATFFVLGWIAERYPELVGEIHERGHEVASHGYGHQLLSGLTREELRADLLKSRETLKSITGAYPVSYRAPGFSITPENEWALEEIAACGFQFDASIYPGKHGHGGHPLFSSDPVEISFKSGEDTLVELPVSVADLFGKRMCFSGGGYLRLLPFFLIEIKFREFNEKGKPVMVYLHPREFDPCGPKLPMPLHRKFKCYVNVKSTEKKMIRLLHAFKFSSVRDIAENLNVTKSIRM